MEIQEAITIVRALADGADPHTGQRLNNEAAHPNPRTIKALNRALAALVAQQEREHNRPANAGRYWTRAEDQQVCEELKRGFDFQQIAKSHNRTVVSIVARLVRLGKIAAKTLPQKPQKKALAGDRN